MGLIKQLWAQVGAVNGLVLVAALNCWSAPSQDPTHPPLPPDAKAYLERLPDGILSLDIVIALALQYSDRFQSVQSQALSLEASALRSRAALDWTLSAKGYLTRDKTEVTSPFQPNDIKSNRYTLGAKSYFRTGTGVNFELYQDRTELKYASSQITPTDLYETNAKWTVTQNLWKDAFGMSTRLGLQAGEELREAAKLELLLAQEEWTVGMVQAYYLAWLAQAQHRASNANLDRRERLLRITKIKSRRGTAEKPDLLQVESAQLQSQTQVLNSGQDLQEKWRTLVIELKLPDTWLSIDPMRVPLRLDQVEDVAASACGPQGRLLPAPELTTELKKYEHQSLAAQLQARQAKNQLVPIAQVYGSLESNGLDTQRSPSVEETIDVSHPAWVVGVEISFPLGRYQEKADLSQALAQQVRAEAQASTVRASQKSRWMNRCYDLYRWKTSVDRLRRSLGKQLERNRLEEKRFDNGRSPLTAVIQAGDDATRAELDHNHSRVQYRLAAWQVLKMTGGVKDYLIRLRENPPKDLTP